MNRKLLRRVDIQVSLLTAAVVFCSTFSVFVLGYHFAYRDMIHSLKERVNAITAAVDSFLDKDTFTQIQSREDTSLDLYQRSKTFLQNIHDATGVMYLYTATENDNGQLIYVLDGLSQDSPDFRWPGDLIESEIQAELRQALAGQEVLPETIKTTDWGKIFIAYMPVHDNAKIIGVVGIEFEAGHQYQTYQMMKTLAPVIILFFGIVSTLISYFVFRRISNPLFHDLSNTDQLTQLKNRNAFEIDMHNLNASRSYGTLCVIVADLNNLKQINDQLGHIQGDLYIQKAAQALKDSCPDTAVLYRTGGDEFAVFLTAMQKTEMEQLCRKISGRYHEIKPDWSLDTSLALGWATAKSGDTSAETVYQRADGRMYTDKARKP